MTSTPRILPWLAALVLGVVVLVPASPALALTVSPAKLEISSDPGQDVHGEFIGIGQEQGSVTYYTSVENFDAQGETGTPQFSSGTDGLATWVEIAPQVAVAPHEQQTIPFTIHIPKDAEAGGHFAAIFLSTNPTSAGGGQVSVGAKIGVLLLLTVSGPINESAGILEFSTQAHGPVFDTLPVKYYYRFHNAGNDRVKPEGVVRVTNIFGKTSATFPGNPVEGNILPNSTRRFEITWEDGTPPHSFFGTAWYEVTHFALGPYTAHLDLSYGSTKQASATHTVFLIPWQLLSLVLGLVLVLLVIFPRLIRRYNRWVVRNSGGPVTTHMLESFLHLLQALASTLGAAAVSGVVSISATVLSYYPPPAPPPAPAGNPPPIVTNTSSAGSTHTPITSTTTIRVATSTPAATSTPSLGTNKLQIISMPGNPYFPWIATRFPTVRLAFPAGTLNYRISFDSKLNGKPSVTRVGAPTSRTFITPFPLGKSYIHVQYQGPRGWSEVYSTIVYVDTNIPSVSVQKVSSKKGKVSFSLKSSDPTSSIKALSVSVDGGVEKAVALTSTSTSVTLTPGTHKIRARATDSAGNQNTATKIVSLAKDGSLTTDIIAQAAAIISAAIRP